MKMEIQTIIKQLNLQPHPEGGYFKETYRSQGSISKENLTIEFSGDRNYSTAIYFMLTSDTFSAFHKINQDEFWHFYKGSPIKLHMISPEGMYTNVWIGNNFEKGEVPQFVVPAQYWFAAEVIANNSYALVGCTVAPGFDFDDFVLAERIKILSLFPEHENIIKRLTRV
ncbi:cupin domain-containing protein [Wenyingzhuangia sp. 2_MG-2023]|uniref:cupin domain-containing protein n=1 Tax=Wenyingzhuangia sp. 2_MG-2023 TaxID=3062639 RepID=UPI0026E483FA|nr:cupin domain-containing protein [Wenyingzhuangia sp. 2_MG-2023]MDO6738645.1 cupin domain-containing protein [Wenyingzhuangia sp. 2_MG-2023]